MVVVAVSCCGGRLQPRRLLHVAREHLDAREDVAEQRSDLALETVDPSLEAWRGRRVASDGDTHGLRPSLGRGPRAGRQTLLLGALACPAGRSRSQVGGRRRGSLGLLLLLLRRRRWTRRRCRGRPLGGWRLCAGRTGVALTCGRWRWPGRGSSALAVRRCHRRHEAALSEHTRRLRLAEGAHRPGRASAPRRHVAIARSERHDHLRTCRYLPCARYLPKLIPSIFGTCVR